MSFDTRSFGWLGATDARKNRSMSGGPLAGRSQGSATATAWATFPALEIRSNSYYTYVSSKMNGLWLDGSKQNSLGGLVCSSCCWNNTLYQQRDIYKMSCNVHPRSLRALQVSEKWRERRRTHPIGCEQCRRQCRLRPPLALSQELKRESSARKDSK